MTADAILAATIPSLLPTLMVLFGILMNKNDINHVRTEISSMRGELAGGPEVRGEISSVRHELGAFRDQTHADIMTLVNIGHAVDKRVSRLEDKGWSASSLQRIPLLVYAITSWLPPAAHRTCCFCRQSDPSEGPATTRTNHNRSTFSGTDPRRLITLNGEPSGRNLSGAVLPFTAFVCHSRSESA